MKALLPIVLAALLLALPSHARADGIRETIASNLESESLRSLSQSSILNDSYSQSPLGFSTFVDFAQALGYPVQRIKDPFSAKHGPDSAVLLLEPVVHDSSPKEVLDAYRWYLENAQTVILVLPKRIAIETNPLGTQLRQTGLIDPLSLWRLTDGAYWLSTIEQLGQLPAWADGLEIDDIQVASSPDASVFEGTVVHVGDETHALVVEGESIGYGRLIIVTDPDIFSNHGIVRGENARVAAEVLELLAPGTLIYVDEALHGYWSRYSFWKAMRSFPASIFIGSLALLALLFLWRRQSSEVSPLRQDASTNPQMAVLRRSADMIAHVIPARRSVERLRGAYVRDAISRGGLRKMNESEAIQRLESLRKPEHSLASLDAERLQHSRLSAAAARRLATQYQQWYREVTHGS